MMTAFMMIITGLVPFLMAAQQAAPTQAAAAIIEKGNFRFSYDARGISGLANPLDP